MATLQQAVHFATQYHIYDEGMGVWRERNEHEQHEAANAQVYDRAWWWPELLKPKRYKAVDGGRGGAKSWTFAQALLHLGSQRPLFIVCAREIQNSLADSVKKLIEDEIRRMNLESYYRSTREEIQGVNGTRFVFKGLRSNPDAVKSLEGCDICWVEEAQSISQESLDMLIPTVRKEEYNDDGELVWQSEVWFSWNEKAVMCPVGERFPKDNPYDNTYRLRVNYYDNPFLPSVLFEEAQACRVLFPARYRSIWLGETGHTEFQILRPEWWPLYVDYTDVERRCTYKFITADTAFETGQENDYSVFQCWGIENRQRLYMLDEVYGKWEFPELVTQARKFWKKHSDPTYGRQVREFWVEKKASGHSLIQTLRREKIKARGWLPKKFQFPDNKIAGFKEMSWIVAPDVASGETTGDVWLPHESIYPDIDSFIDHCGAISEDDSHEHDDRGDAAKMAVSIFRKMGGGRKHGRRPTKPNGGT